MSPKFVQRVRLLAVFVASMLLSLVVCYLVLIMPIINALQELPDDAFNPGMGLYLMVLMFVSGVVSLVAAAILTLIIDIKFLWCR